MSVFLGAEHLCRQPRLTKFWLRGTQGPGDGSGPLSQVAKMQIAPVGRYHIACPLEVNPSGPFTNI